MAGGGSEVRTLFWYPAAFSPIPFRPPATNTVPTATVEGPTTVVRGESTTLTAVVTDPDEGDSWSYQWTLLGGSEGSITGADTDTIVYQSDPDGTNFTEEIALVVEDSPRRPFGHGRHDRRHGAFELMQIKMLQPAADRLGRSWLLGAVYDVNPERAQEFIHAGIAERVLSDAETAARTLKAAGVAIVALPGADELLIEAARAAGVKVLKGEPGKAPLGVKAAVKRAVGR